jgi:hypothetical protein
MHAAHDLRVYGSSAEWGAEKPGLRLKSNRLTTADTLMKLAIVTAPTAFAYVT